MTIMQGPVGISKNQAGAIVNARMGGDADLTVSEYHGRYARATADGKVFSVMTQAVVTTTVGLATTYTGLVLSNPVASNVVLEVNYAAMMQSVIQATQVEGFALAYGFNSTTNVTHTTPATITSNNVGSGIASQARADTSATLPTAPTYYLPLTNTATATQNAPGVTVDLGGSVILQPGAYLLFVTPTQASVNGMWFAFQWIEQPFTTAY